MDIMETIRARYSEVSSVQKRIADYCLEHPDKASFQTLREFAQTTHTTDATVLKFCRNMGYHGFLAFRRQLQEYVRMRLSPNEKVRMSLARSTDANDTCRKIIDGEKRGLDMTFQYLDMEIFMQIVYRMNHARRIFVAGHHLTRIVADFFSINLSVSVVRRIWSIPRIKSRPVISSCTPQRRMSLSSSASPYTRS